MIMLHDLLHRKSGGAPPAAPYAPAAPSIPPAEAPIPPAAAPIPPAATAAKAKRPLPRNPLPDLKLPRQWAMELHKIAFQLTPLEDKEDRPMSFMFSSVAEGAGNTTVSYFFSYILAADAAHRNILFVDFDPELNQPPVPGSRATFFVGQENIEALLVEPDTNLDVISVRVGQDKSVASSTASSTSWFRDFMVMAHKTYDIVVIDSPPIAYTPMAYAPARVCDGVVLVLRCGESRYPAINNLVNDLNEMGITTLGAVLNNRKYPIPKALLKLL